MTEEQKQDNGIVEALANAEAVDPIDETESPVIALGHSVGLYYFISPVGQQRCLKFNEFTYNGILSLFEGDLEWLEKNFPRLTGRKKSSDGYDTDDVTQWLMNSCRRRGLYDSSIHVRKAGVWSDEDPEEGGFPRLIVHSGNNLLIDGKVEKPGRIIGNAFYESAPKIQGIGDKAATKEDAQFLLDTLKMWNYSRGEIDAVLLLGFIGQAMLGAAPNWRVHAMVTAPSGSGKSSLSETIANVFGSGAHDIKNNFTEAGLRQSLTNEARCMMLDEAEAEEGGGRVVKVIELLRHMAGGKGSSGVRGGAGGQSQSFTVTGCAYMASILHVPLKPQDKNRILNLRLLPFDAEHPGADIAELQARMKRLKKMSPALRRRMVDGWHRFLAAFESYHPAFAKEGLTSRSADHLATLYAAKEVMMHDSDRVCGDTIDTEIENARDIIAALKEQSRDNEGAQCLTHLYSSVAEVWRGGERQTVGQMVAAAIKLKDKSENKRLGPFGIRFEPPSAIAGEHDPDWPEGKLIIANESVGLDKLFTGTRWAAGVWSQAFQYLKGAELSKTCRFAGAPARGMIIPKEHWPVVDE